MEVNGAFLALLPVPVAVPSKAWICCRWLAGTVSSIPAGGHGCLSVVCRQVEVPTSGRSLVQRSRTECGVSECDREASIVRRPWPTGGCCTMEKGGEGREKEGGGHWLRIVSERRIWYEQCWFFGFYCLVLFSWGWVRWYEGVGWVQLDS